MKSEHQPKEFNPSDFHPDPQEVLELLDEVISMLERSELKGKMPLTIFEKRNLKQWIEESFRNNMYLREKAKTADLKTKRALRDWKVFPHMEVFQRFFDYYGLDPKLYSQIGGDTDEAKAKFTADLDKARHDTHNL